MGEGNFCQHDVIILLMFDVIISDETVQPFQITKMLPGRTDNAVKNRFHAACRQQSRKDFGDDEKMNYISGGFDCNTDSESVEIESPLKSIPIRPLSAIARIDRDKILGRYSLPSINDIMRVENKSDSSILGFRTSGQYTPSNYDQKAGRERCDKVLKPAKKIKKSASKTTTVVEQEKEYDTAYLNELYIAKLNEFFATPSSISHQMTIPPIYNSNVSGKETFSTHSQQSSNYSAHITLSPALQNTYELPKMGHSVHSMADFRMRASPLGQPFRSPLGQPFIPQNMTSTTPGIASGVAFHELSLKERLAPAPAQYYTIHYNNNDCTSKIDNGNYDSRDTTACNSNNSSSINIRSDNSASDDICASYDSCISISNNFSINDDFISNTCNSYIDLGVNTELGSDQDFTDSLLDDWTDGDMIMTRFYDNDNDVNVASCQSTYECTTNESSIMRGTETPMSTICRTDSMCCAANDFENEVRTSSITADCQTSSYQRILDPTIGSKTSGSDFFTSLGDRFLGKSKVSNTF